MSTQKLKNLRADCGNCFGLCCVALPYAKSADFAFNKDSGTPCKNLNADYRCNIHQKLRIEGFRGCTVYECFGAGQKVSKITYKQNSWRNNLDIANEMFDVFPIMQQLHEMLYYLDEALHLKEAQPLYKDLQEAIAQTEQLTNLSPQQLLQLNIKAHRDGINQLLLQTSERVRANVKNNKNPAKHMTRTDFIGAKLKGMDLRGMNLRGALLIAADLRNSDMRIADFIGADLRDANLSGANLLGSIFLTQAQINAANGDRNTVLPPHFSVPEHW
ncbi:pentapeptide repeat-containing protein [Solibacillus sp. FSL K6-1523]|uniref:pentapeptide repeat-containing protein n=1 Tax=Solibacillus sp. FSL K6-1523 TaxID=2921471 RepID=UPI0030F51EFF